MLIMTFFIAESFTHFLGFWDFLQTVCNSKNRHMCMGDWVKSVRMRSFPAPYFPYFKIRTRKIPNADTFHAVLETHYNSVKHLRQRFFQESS